MKFMKISKIFGVLALLGLVSCTSCAKKETVKPVDPPLPVPVEPSPPSPAPEEAQSIVVSGDHYTFTLPSDYEPRESQLPGIQHTYFNSDLSNLVLFGMQKFEGTLQQYTLLALRGLKESDFEIITTEHTVVNNRDFFVIESLYNDVIKVWAWVTVEGDSGYTLACGGPGDLTDVCINIVQTLKIK